MRAYRSQETSGAKFRAPGRIPRHFLSLRTSRDAGARSDVRGFRPARCLDGITAHEKKKKLRRARLGSATVVVAIASEVMGASRRRVSSRVPNPAAGPVSRTLPLRRTALPERKGDRARPALGDTGPRGAMLCVSSRRFERSLGSFSEASFRQASGPPAFVRAAAECAPRAFSPSSSPRASSGQAARLRTRERHGGRRKQRHLYWPLGARGCGRVCGPTRPLWRVRTGSWVSGVKRGG